MADIDTAAIDNNSTRFHKGNTMQVAIKIHSITDLITNSSTVIYTYSDDSPEACQKMIDAILGALGIQSTCADMFTVSVEMDRDSLSDSLSDMDDDELPDGITRDRKNWRWASEAVNSVLDRVASGEIEKPQWLISLESKLQDESEFAPSTMMVISPKKPEFAPAAEAIRNFLYSTSHEATRDW